jgi:LCP family protein required for cell wall assembly
MFGDGHATAAHHGRYNVLLLGGDSGSDRWGLRPDSITVASIDADTGRTVLFGLPRNMLNFPFPKGSVMAEQFPHGYDCGITCELNSLSTWAQDNEALFKGYPNPGVEATIEGVEGVTGLKINYYAMVNLQGFRSLVQALGGLTLNVRDRIPIGGIGGPITGHIEPGVQKLNGFETLWFARSRSSADDYSRMARQKCVMNAMLQQMSPQTVVMKFEGIAKASEKLVTTDLPASELGRFAELAMKARTQPVSTVSFVPPAINTSHPDIAKIQSMVAAAVKRSESGATPKKQHRAKHGFSTKKDPTGSTVGGSLGNLQDGYAANSSTDLSSAC